MVPGKMVKGMGGAMDLVAGVKRVVVLMEHCTKQGEPKILPECTLPLTGLGVVSRIITDLGVLDVPPSVLVIAELAQGVGLDEVRQQTGVTLQEAGDSDRGESRGRAGVNQREGFLQF